MCAVLLSLAVTAVPSAEICIETNRVVELPVVVVEASRSGVSPLETAQHIEVWDSSALAESGARNLPELAAHVPGLNLYHLGAGNPAMAQIQMRGYGENGFGRVLVSVDGDFLNNFDLYGPNYARIPLSGVRRIEVLYGPQTVLYGDGASAGLINVVTDDGVYDPRSFGEFQIGSWGTVGAAVGTRGQVAESGTGYFANLAYDRSDGFRENSRYDIWNAEAGLRQTFANGSFLRLSSFFNDSAYDLPGPLPENEFRRNPTKSVYRDSAKLTSFGVNLSGRGFINDENAVEFFLTFSQRRAHYTNDDDYGAYTYQRDYASNLWCYRFAPTYLCTAKIFGFKNTLRLGGELKYNRLQGDALDTYPEWKVETRESYLTDRWAAGFFAHDEFWIFDSLSALIGARLERDWNRTDLVGRGSRADNLAAGEIALNYRPVETAKIFLRWCRFYRNPFTDEYRWREGTRTELATPETGWDAELGADWNLTDEWFVSAVAYYSETMNEIHYNPFAMSNENSPWLHRREGIDLSFGWEREKVAGVRIAWSGVNAVKAEGKYKGNWVPGVPRQQLNVEGRVWLWDEFSLSLGYRLIGARYAISDTPNANGRLPAESIFRLGCRYQPTRWHLDGLTISLSCENLFDRNYCDYAVASVATGENAWYPAAGRSILLTIRYEF